MQVVWQEYLTVGVERIDDQHKHLFARFNDLLAACREDRWTEEVTGLFQFLDDYVATHFADEEALMMKTGFPDYEIHRKQHLGFVDEVASLKERVRSEMPTRHPITSVPRFMTGWLIDHISRMDSAIGRFVKGKGADEQGVQL